jgi:16S rRNA processing protein RimM
LQGFVTIGRVGRPHGVQGEFSVSDPTERGELLEPGKVIWLEGAQVTIAWRKGTLARPLLKVEGVDDRDAARALAGAEIGVPREELGPLAPGEYLVEELIGAEVVDGDRWVGRVRDVVVLPSVEALEVEREGRETLLVPLVRDAIRSIAPSRDRIDVRLDFVEAEA